jgi:protein-S-isoprenylcysteine O-methyltransferase Ste14
MRPNKRDSSEPATTPLLNVGGHWRWVPDHSRCHGFDCAMLKSLSILGYVGMVSGLLGLAVMRVLFSPSTIVILPQVAAFMLLVWARVVFGRRSFHAAANPTAGGLVTCGPYRYIRHPIYTSVCLFAGAAIAWHFSWQAGVCGGVLLGGTLLRMRCEEILVTARYPEYTQYATGTWRMIPYVY